MQLDYDMKRSATGFTLVEIALVLVIIGFVTTGLLRMFGVCQRSCPIV
jgi:prepilin-type N-terminal cleavage/methylation domain-containing protein